MAPGSDGALLPRGRRSPLNSSRFQISLAAVVVLVVLHLSLGCHFLYEGLWKIRNAKEFSAESYLAQAKGPTAPLFYAMLPDIDGRAAAEDRAGHAQGRKRQRERGPAKRPYVNAWTDQLQRFKQRYKPDGDQLKKAEATLEGYQRGLDDYLAGHKAAIEAYFKGLDLLDAARKTPGDDTATHRQRIWDKQEDLRREGKVWLGELDKMSMDFQNDLWNILSEDQRKMGWIGSSANPLRWSRIEQINFMVTWGLTAIGACLILGLCTRLAALGGAVFMLFVVLTQFPWPTVYPLAPAEVGHALWVNKDWIEMMALLVMVAIPVGRWGGLDCFLHRWFCRRSEDA